ncbi:MAG: IclR family transcriptional regulator [Xanthobacteraceae bacterium]|nr:IclR family transcriptional regulator [Xanthobacteraceae bacterium]
MSLQGGTSAAKIVAPVMGVREADADGKDRKFVTALARGLEVLRAFTPSEGQLGNGEIAERTGLAKPTVSRLTYTLTKLGYLAHLERLGKYQLTPAALALGYSALANMRIRQVARVHMQELADYAGASVALGTRDRLGLIYVEHCRSKYGVMLRLALGSRIPVATTAMGRAMIAAMSEPERDWLLGYVKRAEGKNWPQVKAGIERAVKEVAARGFTLSLGEWERDINAVGAACLAPDGSGLFAFNCGAPAFQFTRERLESDIGPRLVNMVRNVEVDLGGR